MWSELYAASSHVRRQVRGWKTAIARSTARCRRVCSFVLVALCKRHHQKKKTAAVPSSPAPSAALTLPSNESLKVLIVDDSEPNRKLLSRMLTKLGHSPLMASNGQEALDVVFGPPEDGKSSSIAGGGGDGGSSPGSISLHVRKVSSRIDAILMDLQMPVMDGLTATRALRMRSYLGRIIALTAHEEDSKRVECLKAGCDGFLSKPVTISKLIETLPMMPLSPAISNMLVQSQPADPASQPPSSQPVVVVPAATPSPSPASTPRSLVRLGSSSRLAPSRSPTASPLFEASRHILVPNQNANPLQPAATVSEE